MAIGVAVLEKTAILPLIILHYRGYSTCRTSGSFPGPWTEFKQPPVVGSGCMIPVELAWGQRGDDGGF